MLVISFLIFFIIKTPLGVLTNNGLIDNIFPF